MADLVFDRNFDPQYGRAVTIAPGVRRVTARNAGPLTFHGTNSYIVGTGDLAVIDPGPDDDSHFAALTAASTGETVSAILVTHAHRDHSGGAFRLAAATGAQVNGVALGNPITDGAVIAGNSWQLETIATPGHARDHVVFALAGSDLIFSGDHVMGWSTTVVAPPEGAMVDYRLSLDRLLARSEDTYLPGHGGPIARAHAYVRALKEHRMAREGAILSALAAGPRTTPEIVAEVYAELDPALAEAAGLSVLAHLEDLIARGRVAGDDGPDGRYRLIPG
jgi:glyoxylase-like metal-dependent hydrolase (beta-lactamase superfamily II)